MILKGPVKLTWWWLYHPLEGFEEPLPVIRETETKLLLLFTWGCGKINCPGCDHCDDIVANWVSKEGWTKESRFGTSAGPLPDLSRSIPIVSVTPRGLR